MKVNHTSYWIFGLQLIAHLAIFPFIWYAVWYHYAIVILVYIITGCFGMTMTYHRLLSHRSWAAPKWFEKFGTFAGVYGLVGSPIAWVALHREHHHHTDLVSDPHSPEEHGFAIVQWLSMFAVPKPKYAVHLFRDKWQLFVHQRYIAIHISIIIFWLCVSPMMLLSAYLVPAAILWNMGSFINTLTHITGYRNFDSNDDSTNITILGYLVFGEGWHNNHHAFPNNASFQSRWWEFDLGGWFIRRLEVRE